MAFNFQNIGGLEKQKDFGDILKQGNELYQSNYKFKQAKTLNDLFAKHVGSDGTLNDVAFYRDAKAAGLGDEMIKTAVGNKTVQSDAAVKEATNQDALQLMGRNPDTTRAYNNPETQTSMEDVRNRSWMGQKPSEWLNGPTIQKPAEPDTRTEERKRSDAEWDASVAVNPIQVTPSIETKEETVLDPVTGEYKTTILEPASKSKAVYVPQDPGTYDMSVNPGTLKRTYSGVEEMLRPGENQNTGINKKYDTINNPYKLTNMGVGSLYAKDWLTKSGLPVSQEGLDLAFQTYISSVQKPSIKSKDGKIDLYATREDERRYEAELQKKSAEFMKDIIAGNTVTIGEKVAQDKLQMDKEKRVEEARQDAADIGGRLAGETGFTGIVRTRDVSKEEKTKGDTIANGYQDYKDAMNEKDPSIKGYRLALAKSKADGNVTKDVVVANMVASGTIPSAAMIAVKAAMDESGNISVPAFKALLSEVFGSSIGAEPSKTWVEANRKNIEDQLNGVGYAVVDTKRPADKAPGTLGTSDIAKKTPKPEKKSDKAPKVGDIKKFPNGRKAKYDGKGWRAI